MQTADFVPGAPPTAQDVIAARKAANMTQAQAAAAVYLGGQPRWAEYEHGHARMNPARFELFLIKTGLHQDYSRRAGASSPLDQASA